MPKYLVQATYTTEGAKGLLKDGGSKRRAVVDKAIGALGGKVESFYFAFGSADVVIIVDLPDAVAAAAVSLSTAATGAVKLKTSPLLTPEEVDAASKKSTGYTPPGA
jgi:uncharacterized protein with GYD domain